MFTCAGAPQPRFLHREPDAVGDLRRGSGPGPPHTRPRLSRPGGFAANCGHSRNANGCHCARTRETNWPAATATAPRVALRRRPPSCWRESAREPSQAPRSADVGNGFQLSRASSAPSSLARVQSPDPWIRGFSALSWPAVESRGIARAPLVAASQVLRLVFGHAFHTVTTGARVL